MKTIGSWIEEQADRVITTHGDFISGCLEHQDEAEVFISGSSLLPKAGDVDVFLTPGSTWFISHSSKKRLFETDNAITCRDHGQVIQLCKFAYQDLRAMITAFDFAHCQMGVRARITKIRELEYVDSDWTPEFINARVTGDTWFTSGAMPVSSIVRLLKFHKRGMVSRRSAVDSVIKILAQIADDGFVSREDFEAQVNGIEDDVIERVLRNPDRKDVADALDSLYENLKRR
jgi:hypothetical protein